MLAVNAPLNDAAVHAIERPHRDLLRYYVLASLVFPPAFPFLILPLYFRYNTMRYTFTEEGISMRWGILFRHEIIIHYARIQDIHLRANLVERWLGLARILVQTASGSSGAEMTIEGLKEFEAVRDYLYQKMRGVKEHAPSASHSGTSIAAGAASAVVAPAAGGNISNASSPSTTGSTATAANSAELAAALREVARELRETRLALQQRAPAASASSTPTPPRHD